MFGRMLKMEFVRACRPSRVLLVSLLVLILLVGSDWQMMENALKGAYGKDGVGSIEFLTLLMSFDTFKCVFVVLMAGLYTNSFCKDDNGKYLRMILNRVNVTTYTQCRFLANLLTIWIVSVCSFYLYTIVMRPWMPLLPEGGTEYGMYYVEFANKYPVLYVGMIGYVFGLVAAACSSVGVLFSVYKPNAFVSIGISGLVFFLAMSYIPYGTPFNVLNIVSMSSTIGLEAPCLLMFLWTNLYMLSIIGICGFLFYRRMKWRVENGYV